MRELYRVLEVEPGADFETVRASYRRLLKRYHPDSGGATADPGRLDSVLEAFRRLSRSYDVSFGPRRHSSGEQPQSVFDLGQTLASAESVTTRTFAARSLGNLGKRSAYPYLRTGLKDPDRRVVIASLRAIGRLRVTHAVGDLSALFHGAEAEVRRVVMETVGEIGRLSVFRNLLLAGLEDADPAVRRRALRLYVRLER
ncbi:MAG: HEAT repeat domain-containing protein [Spirochaetaceae bacterium]